VRERGYVLDAASVLAWATRAPAKALGMADKIGSLEIGKRADMILLDADSPRLVPMIDGAGVLVHSASGSDVRSVVIDGRIVIEDGKLLSADGPALVRDAQKVAAGLWGEAGRRVIG
jgi:5-methylthioadenosine/S-adenosylhomocysteine deaminase